MRRNLAGAFAILGVVWLAKPMVCQAEMPLPQVVHGQMVNGAPPPPPPAQLPAAQVNLGNGTSLQPGLPLPAQPGGAPQVGVTVEKKY